MDYAPLNKVVENLFHCRVLNLAREEASPKQKEQQKKEKKNKLKTSGQRKSSSPRM